MVVVVVAANALPINFAVKGFEVIWSFRTPPVIWLDD
jgi:hypothetical protein